MKFTKRMLATLLTLALALGWALPTMAAVNWDEFRITKQPEGMTIKHGESFTLSVEVNVPDGVEVTYRWQCKGVFIENANTRELRLGPDDLYYPSFERLGGNETSYQCWITPYEDGNAIPMRIRTSNTVNVKIERSISGKLLDVTIAPFGYAFTMVIMSPALALIFPISYIGCLIYAYYVGFRALFS